MSAPVPPDLAELLDLVRPGWRTPAPSPDAAAAAAPPSTMFSPELLKQLQDAPRDDWHAFHERMLRAEENGRMTSAERVGPGKFGKR